MLVFSWVVMLFHSLKLGFFVMSWLTDRFGLAYRDFIGDVAERRIPADLPMLNAVLDAFHRKIDGHLQGEGRGCVMPEFGGIYWDVEETAFLTLSENFAAFFAELEVVVSDMLQRRGITFDPEELAEVIRYQSLRTPRRVAAETVAQHRFAFNLPEYFDAYFTDAPVTVRRSPQHLAIEHKDYGADKPSFARETILWGRKSGLMLTRVSWRDGTTEITGGISARESVAV